MDNDISLLLAWADHTRPGAFANLHASRTSSSGQQNSDTRFRGAPQHASFVDYVRILHAPACIPPAFLRRIVARTVRARVAHRPPFADDVSSRRAKSQPARIPCSHWNYSLSCTFGESGVSIRESFSRKVLCAFRASILSTSKSKTDSKSAA